MSSLVVNLRAKEASNEVIRQVLASINKAFDFDLAPSFANKVIVNAISRASIKVLLAGPQVGKNIDMVKFIASFLEYDPSFPKVCKTWRSAVEPWRLVALKDSEFVMPVKHAANIVTFMTREFETACEELVKMKRTAQSRLLDLHPGTSLSARSHDLLSEKRRKVTEISLRLHMAERAYAAAISKLAAYQQSKAAGKKQMPPATQYDMILPGAVDI